MYSNSVTITTGILTGSIKDENWIIFCTPKMHYGSFEKKMMIINENRLISHFFHRSGHTSWRIETNELPHDNTNKMTCEPNEDSQQPGHPPSIIRVFVVRSVGS